ncbi:flotillin domain-containing protein [Acinetobacter terrae]|uniref:flotillin domain-containing protein n=1 Tax=Acinetobacter terrae TaxID=2731247 RepID=UPI0007D7BBA0|nr:flotillin domain-containing protein [Acinetobacter terrae]NNH15614.1 flotillin family protein [Acinetobacter terrae]OAL85347.1 flotillin [Acinetobacter terrae]
MLMSNLYNILIIAGVIFAALIIIGIIIARLYQRSSKEISFVRTGFGGEKVILGGGAIVLPVLHETIPVNMNTLRLEVRRADDQALITRDRMRVDVMAEFYVRVKPTAESIATAAQTLGQKTMSPNELKNLVEGKFVDSLRAVAAEMAMEELHEKRVDFVQKVQQVVSEDLFKNGLELETVSLTGLDQTGFKYFNPQNAFDAEGLTKLTETIEDRRRKRNHIEQDTDLAIKTKNLEAEQARLQILREEEYAKMQQEREISIRKAEQQAEIAMQEAAKKREAEEAQIAAEREVDLKRITAARDVENQNIQKSQIIQQAQVEQKKTIELAEQIRAIAIAEKSREESEAKASADRARAEAVKAEEEVITVRETQRAERQKAVELVAAKQAAEKDAIAITVAAEAGKKAAIDDAEAVRIAAEANAEKERLKAKGEADARILLAQAMEKQYQVDAEGTRAVNEANNILSTEQVEMQIRLALLKYLPEIIRESVKPMENIDDIKILQVSGLGGIGGSSTQGEGYSDHGQIALSDQVVNSALRYRTQAPLIDSLMNELGIQGGDINGLTQSLKPQVTTPK